jgi:Fe/S biogenesis protein NfuA
MLAAGAAPVARYRSTMEPVLEVTQAAIEKVVLVRAREPEPESLGLWIEVTGRDALARTSYDLWLAPVGEAPADARVEQHGPVPIVIPGSSVAVLRGAVLDRDGDLTFGGLVIHEPEPASPAVGTGRLADLTGDAAERVRAVLERQINPAIAGHGGAAELVAVEDGTAYLRLGGGCQGCGMVAVTLRQGIERAIREAAPEITRVVDVTDHARGANPYYESGIHG